MGYYRGDYYRGDYYRGDPFLGAALGFLAKKVAPKLVAKVGSWVGGRIGGKAVVKRLAGTVLREAVPSTIAGAVGYQLGQSSQLPTLSPLEEEQGMTMQGGQQSSVAIFMSRDGRRIRKRWSVSQQRWIAIRKLNPLNPKALRRGLKRAYGFDKFARKTMNALYRTVPGKVKQRRFKKA